MDPSRVSRLVERTAVGEDSEGFYIARSGSKCEARKGDHFVISQIALATLWPELTSQFRCKIPKHRTASIKHPASSVGNRSEALRGLGSATTNADHASTTLAQFQKYQLRQLPNMAEAGEETAAQRQARIRREKREAKIKAGGSERLDKIT